MKELMIRQIFLHKMRGVHKTTKIMRIWKSVYHRSLVTDRFSYDPSTTKYYDKSTAEGVVTMWSCV